MEDMAKSGEEVASEKESSKQVRWAVGSGGRCAMLWEEALEVRERDGGFLGIVVGQAVTMLVS